MATLAHYAPMAGLLFFFCVYVGIALWAWRPGAKNTLQTLAEIPLKENE